MKKEKEGFEEFRILYYWRYILRLRRDVVLLNLGYVIFFIFMVVFGLLVLGFVVSLFIYDFSIVLN